MKLLLLPGLDGSGLLFKPLLDALPTSIDVQVIGYPREKFLTVPELAGLAASRLPPGEQVVLLAESFSGLVCLELLRRNSPQVSAVIFVACFSEAQRPLLQWLSRFVPLSWFVRLPVPDALIRRYLLGHHAEAAMVELVRTAVSAVKPTVFAGRLRELGGSRRQPSRISLPCAYIQAMNDRLVPETALNAFKLAAPQIEVHRIAGPHFILQACPEDCAALIADFVRRQHL